MKQLPLETQLEAVLFWKAEPLTVKELGKILDKDEREIRDALSLLKKNLEGRGVALLERENEVEIRTAPEAGALIERLTKEELSKDLGKAGLETLSIILYQGPVARREIDYIRGVNSNFIVRNLLVRGLIERVPNPDDERSFLYKATNELYSYLGITRIDELPEYEKVRSDIENFKKAEEHEHKEGLGESVDGTA